LHQVGDLFELNIKLRCERVNKMNMFVFVSARLSVFLVERYYFVVYDIPLCFVHINK